MATDQRNLPAFLADDATFRTWGSGLAAQFTAVGLVQASDTGQINWTTVAKPTVVSTYAGYEIWRFNDSLQTTNPVFIKIEYGVGAAVDRPSLRFTVSTATNGAGTPTGQVSSVMTRVASGSKSSGITLPSYCSGSASRLSLCTNVDGASTSFGFNFMVERSKSAAGADTGDLIVLFSSVTGASQALFQILPFVGSVPSGLSATPALDSLAGGLSVIGSDVLVTPTVVFYGKPLFASWCGYVRTDIGALVTFAMTHLGAARTYLPLSNVGSLASAAVITANASFATAMLWE